MLRGYRPAHWILVAEGSMTDNSSAYWCKGDTAHLSTLVTLYFMGYKSNFTFLIHNLLSVRWKTKLGSNTATG